MYKEKLIEKKYFSIEEASKETGLSKSKIRFWCKEIGIQVQRKRSGFMKFTREDLEFINKLTSLDGRLTILGMKELYLNKIKVENQTS